MNGSIIISDVFNTTIKVKKSLKYGNYKWNILAFSFHFIKKDIINSFSSVLHILNFTGISKKIKNTFNIVVSLKFIHITFIYF